MPAESRGEFGLQLRAVERGGLVGLDSEHRAALHELALDAKERFASVCARDQAIELGADGEKLRDEVVQDGRHGEEEFGLLLGGERIGPLAGCRRGGLSSPDCRPRAPREIARRGARGPRHRRGLRSVCRRRARAAWRRIRCGRSWNSHTRRGDFRARHAMQSAPF